MTMFLALAATCLGAVVQRVAGMGFALVVAPFLILALGPSQGVVVVNLCGAAVGLVTWALTRAQVDWHKVRLLLYASPFGALAGALAAARADPDWTYVIIGAALGTGLAATLVATRLRTRTVAGPLPAAVAGFTTGALVTAAGVGAPPMTIYAELTRWDQPGFAASMQPLTVVISAIGAGAALLVPGSTPHLAAPQWAAITAALAAGTVLGAVLGPRTSVRAARTAVISLAAAGALATLVRGVAGVAT